VVNDGLIDGVFELRDFETLKGLIIKIKTSVAELKIIINFRRVIRTFSFNSLALYRHLPIHLLMSMQLSLPSFDHPSPLPLSELFF
jgi:hypothetical protein